MTKKKEKGQLIVLSGPSGVGKSTVIAELLGQRKGIYFSVSYTTRQCSGVNNKTSPPRKNSRLISSASSVTSPVRRSCWNTRNM